MKLKVKWNNTSFKENYTVEILELYQYGYLIMLNTQNIII